MFSREIKGFASILKVLKIVLLDSLDLHVFEKFSASFVANLSVALVDGILLPDEVLFGFMFAEAVIVLP